MARAQLQDETQRLTAYKDPGHAERRHDAKKNNSHRFYKYCYICSEFSTCDHKSRSPIFHVHYSSLFERINSTTDNNLHYLCTTCEKTPHSTYTGERYPILVTSSIMHDWQKAKHLGLSDYRGNPMHCETISIPGATIPMLRHALVTEYSQSHRPIDVLWCSGLNDVMQDRPVSSIVKQLRITKKIVLEWSNFRGIYGNTFGICTLPLPPSICRLSGDKRPFFQDDKTSEIIALNNAIMEINSEPSQHLDVSIAPRFHSWGLGSVHGTQDNFINIKQSKRHRSAEWREKNCDKKLHFADRVRIRMGKNVIRYFWKLYGGDPKVLG